MVDKPRCGRVAIVGRGNVGKSTLLNSLLGEKLSIITNWTGATRKPMTGILNVEWGQIVLIDTPTFLTPRNKLERIMLSFIKKSLSSSDLALLIVDVNFPPSAIEKQLCSLIKKNKLPAFLLLNKIDLVRDYVIEQRSEEYLEMFKNTFFSEVMPISALLKDNLPFLLKRIKNYLPEKEPIYKNPLRPPKELLIKEAIREEITNFFHNRQPQSMEVILKEMKPPQGQGKIYILAYLYIEDEKFFPLILGWKGHLLSQAKHRARLRCERLLKEAVYLDLIVRTRKKWRNDIASLSEFGYLKRSL